jgi:MerR family transcriptional regulator, thiopeptide resistance regulator
MSTNTYSVSQVSRMAHVTVRTLHHYDEIGLLTPSQRGQNGYRQYTDGDLERLQQILLFKELGFSLDAIYSLIDEPAPDRKAALLSQRELLRGELRKTNAVIRAIDTALHVLEETGTMSSEKMFDGFDEFGHAQYADEARERWGDTDAYKESARRARKYSKQDWQRMKEEMDAVHNGMAEMMRSGKSADDPKVAALAEQHRLHIDRWFYPCSHQMHQALGDMYIADPRFTATYEKIAPGLAQYVRDAIAANAAAQS